jgi:signal peptidase II
MLEYESISLLNGTFFLTYIKNSGIAFGLLPEYNSVYAISALIIACGIMIFMWFHKGKLNKAVEIGLYMVIAGAVGNIIDRLVYEYVVDFIELGFVNFAVFNIADISITLGAFIAVVALMFEKDNEN